jgi:hypothetical protein
LAGSRENQTGNENSLRHKDKLREHYFCVNIRVVTALAGQKLTILDKVPE